jgi:two-component sensor histidine kinase
MFTFHSRLIRPTAPLLVALIVVSCAYRFIASSLVAAQEPAKPGANRINDLLKERLATLREIARLQSARFKNGQAAVEEVQEAIRRLLEAELELCDSLRDRIAVLEKYVDQAKDLEKIATLFFKTGQGR